MTPWSLSHLTTAILAFIASHLARDYIPSTIPTFDSPVTTTSTLLSSPLSRSQLQDQLGEHVLLEITSSPFHLLNELESLKKATRTVLQQANLTIVALTGHSFTPQGISVVAVLAESHLSIHTWPELGYASIDVYTCGLEIAGRAARAARGLVKYLEAEHHHMSVVPRGIPLVDQLIPSTPPVSSSSSSSRDL
jgi:S-adenosylmethionine decarboxylase